jgi:hypothetical protein
MVERREALHYELDGRTTVKWGKGQARSSPHNLPWRNHFLSSDHERVCESPLVLIC